jgi:hypothetical protein
VEEFESRLLESYGVLSHQRVEDYLK